MGSRRGFSIVELLVALVLMLIVAGAAYQFLINTQRVSRTQAERATMQGNMRAGALIVPADLRGIGWDSAATSSAPSNATDPDILSMSSSSIQFRSVWGTAIVCAISGSQITVDTTTGYRYSAYRAPVTDGRDSLMVFADFNPTIGTDDRWVRAPLTGVAGGTCGSKSGLTFTTDLSLVGSANVLVGAPVRIYEVKEYSLYASGGRNYLGAQVTSAASSSMQPVLGPLAGSGFRLDYLDSAGTAITGNTVADRRKVRTIRVTLIGQSDKRITSGLRGDNTLVSDSVVTMVALRNALHH